VAKTCLVGCGYWGKNILRNLFELKALSELLMYDTETAKMTSIKNAFQDISIASSWEAVLQSDVDSVIIATPTKTHYELAKTALLAGKHVLVEKPMTTSVKQALELGKIAEERGLILMVDHIFLYNPVVKKMKEYFTSDFLGKINYIDTTRINLGIYQNDINVLWDLACHDISIVNYLIDESPKSVRAVGRINPKHGLEDIAYLFLYYSSNLLVQINSSWASPVKMRKMIVGGDERMLIYNDIEPTNKLTIYDYEHDMALDTNKNRLTDYRLGNITIPKYEQQEPLKNVIQEFFYCIATKKLPLTDAQNAIDVIRILEKAQESLKLDGAKLPLS
jgi:predicted dehydrogenase